MEVLRTLEMSLDAPLTVRLLRALEAGCAPVVEELLWLLNMPRRMVATLSGSAFSRE